MRTYGVLTSKEYGQILRDFRESRTTRFEMEQEATRGGGKIAELLETHGANWWVYYELPLAHHVALMCLLMGWGERLKAINAEKNPQRAFLAFMKEQDADDAPNPVNGMTPEQQAACFNVLLSGIYSIEALGYYSMSINELLARAREGKREYFLKAVCIDRAVIGTDTGIQIIAQAQLRRDKGFLSGLFKRIKSPHSKLRTYADLRMLRRVFEEANALTDNSYPELLDLICNQLRVVAPQDAKGLADLFRVWAKS